MRTFVSRLQLHVLGLALCLSLSLLGQAEAKLKIVASTPDLAALASEVGGDKVSVTALSKANENPHYVDPKPSLVVALSRADMMVSNGMDLEIGWLPPLLTNARNASVQLGGGGYVDASSVVTRLEAPASVDRSLGDIHPAGNPHFLFDPREAAKVATAIAERLAALSPEDGEHFRANAAQLSLELRTFADEERQRFQALGAEKLKVITYHRSLVYLLAWLGIERPINIEPKPGVSPSPSHVARVLGTMRAQKIDTILQERFYPTKTSKTLARMAGGEVTVLAGGTDFQAGQRYLDHMRALTEAVYAALSH